MSGDLEWLTRLADSAEPGTLYPKVIALDGALYAITFNSLAAAPFTVYKLALNGTLLWSKGYGRAGEGLQAFAATPDGGFYLLHTVGDNERAISAFDEAGTARWESPTFADSTELVAARDGSLYETGASGTDSVFRVSKRATDGTLQWTQAVAPSLPHFDYDLNNYTTLYVADDGVYAVATFLEQNRDFYNKEVTRLDAAGEKVWSDLVIPRGQPLPSCDYLSEHCLGVLGVGADGTFYASRGDVLVYLSATGERVDSDELEWYGDLPTGRAMAQAILPEFGATMIFYEVGITGGDEASTCENKVDTDPTCAYTDIYVQQSRLNLYLYEDGSLADVRGNLRWSSR